MKFFKLILVLPIFCLLFTGIVQGQTLENLLGNVVKVDEKISEITIKTQNSEEKSFKIFGKTSFLRIKSNDKTLENAEKISLNEVKQGNRILARGFVSPESKQFLAQTLIVLEQDSAANESKPIQGRVTFVDATKKEIKIKQTAPSETAEIVIDASSATTNFRRYAFKSTKFNDSLTSSFEQIKIGDQLKSNGSFVNGSATFKPNIIVSGTFQTIGGRISALDLNAKEITIVNFQNKQAVKLKLMDDVKLKKLTKEKEEQIVKTYFKGSTTDASDASKNLFEDLLDVPLNDLAVGKNVILSVAVDEKNNPAAVSFLLVEVDRIFQAMQELERKTQRPVNLGALNL